MEQQTEFEIFVDLLAKEYYKDKKVTEEVKRAFKDGFIGGIKLTAKVLNQEEE